MDIGTVGGLVLGVVAMILTIILGGGNPIALIDIPSMVVVFGGTCGALLMAFPLAKALKVHTVFLSAIFGNNPDPLVVIKDLVKFAEIARREGILSLENHMDDVGDPFIVRGLKMAVDGSDPELIQTIMETELEGTIERHIDGKRMLDTIGRYAPAFGMIGTLMGLIFMLQNMDDPSSIGGGMAVALVTTLYGALVANVLANPVADKLAAKDAEETLVKTIIIAGVMSIQSGDNPRVVESKLMTYLPPARRGELENAEAA